MVSCSLILVCSGTRSGLETLRVLNRGLWLILLRIRALHDLLLNTAISHFDGSLSRLYLWLHAVPWQASIVQASGLTCRYGNSMFP